MEPDRSSTKMAEAGLRTWSRYVVISVLIVSSLAGNGSSMSVWVGKRESSGTPGMAGRRAVSVMIRFWTSGVRR